MGKPAGNIIIKKVKKGGHGHHGGAWKVAYADFVTAMMAFFLLMWLLTATPVENLQGLADYFTPTLGVEGKMGIGFSGGQSPNTEGVSQGDWASQGLIFGAPPSGPILKLPDQQDNKTDDTQNDYVSFTKQAAQITETITQNKELSKYKDNIQIEQTPEGLNIQIIDQDQRPMFKKGSAELQPHAKLILEKIAEIVGHIPNYIKITGHTNALKESPKAEYSNWELSADRANAARRFLVQHGVEDGQVTQIVGNADHDPLDKENPSAPVNTRISVTLLRKAMIAEHKQSAPEDILLGPVEEGLKSYIKEQKKEQKEEQKREDELKGEQAPTKEVPTPAPAKTGQAAPAPVAPVNGSVILPQGGAGAVKPVQAPATSPAPVTGAAIVSPAPAPAVVPAPVKTAVPPIETAPAGTAKPQ